MHKDRIIKVLIHPFFIGFILVGLFVIILNPEISKYRVEILRQKTTPYPRKIHYTDIDNDQISEEIVIVDTLAILNILVIKENHLIDQYNLKSKVVNNDYFYSGDYDFNGYNEIYFLTYRNDSILLSIIDTKQEQPFLVFERLIFHNDSFHYDVDAPQVHSLGLEDFNEGQGNNYVFAITAGFSKQPRQVFKYNIHNDELICSPLSGVSINNPSLHDIDYDSIPEILLNTAATWNYGYSFPYGDHTNWFMILDNDLKFKIEPFEFSGYPSSLFISYIKNQNLSGIIAYHDYYGADTITSRLYTLDNKGKVLHSRTIVPGGRGSVFCTVNNYLRNPTIYLIDSEAGSVSELDFSLKILNERKIPQLYGNHPLAILDINEDGYNEYIFYGEDNGSFVIFTDRMAYPVIVHPDEDTYPSYLCTKKQGNKNEVYAQYNNVGYFVRYDRNIVYPMRFPLLALIYLLFFSTGYKPYRQIEDFDTTFLSC